MKTSKSAGLDNISPRLFKDSAEIIASPLIKIMNASMAEGVVPTDWKNARVTPMFKKGKPNDMDNYRPISVLPVASKLLEREHQLLSPYQCGFRKNHSTECATISFTDSIRRGMDQGLLTGAVLIDLRKPFDTVDHQTLNNKLQSYGIMGTELSWFADYLRNRKQMVGFGSELSDPCPITFGVPQGSILGPFLFILLVNDLPLTTNHCSILMYADDTVL